MAYVVNKRSDIQTRDDLTGLREYVQVHQVVFDGYQSGPISAKNVAGVPQYGDYYKGDTEDDKFAFLQSRDVKREADSDKSFLVTSNFTTAANNGTGGLTLPQPQEVNLTPTIEWGFVEFQSLAIFHKVRNTWVPIRNSAWDLFDPPLPKDDSRLALRITKNLGQFNPLLAYQYSNAINSDEWLGFPQYTVMFKPPQASLKLEKGYQYWEVKFEFHFNFETWLAQVVDAGMRDRWNQGDLDDLKKRKPKDAAGIVKGYNHITNQDGVKVAEPTLLDGFGHRLIFPSMDATLSEVQPFIHKFHIYRELPFTPLNLP
jgi:hypothetical protein